MSSKNFQKLYVSKILRLSAILLFFKDRKFFSRLLKFKYLQDISGCVLRLTHPLMWKKKIPYRWSRNQGFKWLRIVRIKLYSLYFLSLKLHWCHHQLNGYEFEQTLGDSEGQRSLVCCMGLQWVGHNLVTGQQQNNEINKSHFVFSFNEKQRGTKCSRKCFPKATKASGQLVNLI